MDLTPYPAAPHSVSKGSQSQSKLSLYAAVSVPPLHVIVPGKGNVHQYSTFSDSRPWTTGLVDAHGNRSEEFEALIDSLFDHLDQNAQEPLRQTDYIEAEKYAGYAQSYGIAPVELSVPAEHMRDLWESAYIPYRVAYYEKGKPVAALAREEFRVFCAWQLLTAPKSTIEVWNRTIRSFRLVDQRSRRFQPIGDDWIPSPYPGLLEDFNGFKNTLSKIQSYAPSNELHLTRHLSLETTSHEQSAASQPSYAHPTSQGRSSSTSETMARPQYGGAAPRSGNPPVGYGSASPTYAARNQSPSSPPPKTTTAKKWWMKSARSSNVMPPLPQAQQYPPLGSTVTSPSPYSPSPPSTSPPMSSRGGPAGSFPWTAEPMEPPDSHYRPPSNPASVHSTHSASLSGHHYTPSISSTMMGDYQTSSGNAPNPYIPPDLFENYRTTPQQQPPSQYTPNMDPLAQSTSYMSMHAGPPQGNPNPAYTPQSPGGSSNYGTHPNTNTHYGPPSSPPASFPPAHLSAAASTTSAATPSASHPGGTKSKLGRRLYGGWGKGL